MNKSDEYEQKMRASILRREFILREINRLFDEYQTLEKQEKTWSDEEFIRTGSSTFSLKVNISVTESEMLQDLVKRTEGKNIKPEEPNSN